MINNFQIINTLAIEISNSVVSKRNYFNGNQCFNMKEVIVKQLEIINIILILWLFQTSTETLILCGFGQLYIYKLDLNGIQGSGFILKSHSLSLIKGIFQIHQVFYKKNYI